MTIEEKLILEAVSAVEKLGADVRLTSCVISLSKAKDHLSDFVDGIEFAVPESPGPYGLLHGLLHLGRGTFGEAIHALKSGHRVARAGWNGKGMFIFMRPADELEVGFIIDKVKSLPQSVKNLYHKIVNTAGNEDTKKVFLSGKVKFGAYICMYAADGSIVNGWLASQTDILSEDWCIVE